MNAGLDLRMIDELTGGKLGVHDARCPLCGPERRSPANQRRRVLRIWRLDPGLATFHCARCGESGHVRDGTAARIDSTAIKRAKAEAAERERAAVLDRLGKARWLWSKRRSLAGSIGERYLREARSYRGPLPPTLGFLPARGDHGPAMIAAFGVPEEPEPGRLAMADDAVRGVHITRLAPDGSDRERGEKAKIMIGAVRATPIVVSPVNDLGGLAVVEGIEDGLSVFEATGLGIWVAGAAAFMPALADRVPSYVESITIFSHPDPAGVRHAQELADALLNRGSIEVRIAAASHRIVARNDVELLAFLKGRAHGIG